MITNCPVCGKAFDVLWPQLWAYKDGSLYFCTWKCLRQMRKEAEKMKTLTEDEKRAAAEVALTGGNPLPYLKSLGVTNVTTSWNTVRNWARGHMNQDEYEKLPEKLGKEKPKAERSVPPVLTPEERAEIRQEIAEQEKRAVEKENSRPLEAAALKSRILKASWKYQDGHVFLEGPDLSMSMITMTAKEWIALSYEIRTAIRQLGIVGE